FARDLELVERAVVSAKAKRAAHALVMPLLAQVRMLGFHGYHLDVRDDSDTHTGALRAIAESVGIPPLDGEALRRELLGRRPLTSPNLSLDAQTEKVLAVFDAIRDIQDELGEQAASTYIISMTHHPDDLLRVLLLARERGLVDLSMTPSRSRLDIVPLFETRDDLAGAAQVMRSDLEKVLAVFDAIRDIQDELGEQAASTYIISMTHHPDDLLRVLLLARERGLVDLSMTPSRSRLDIVPLFETRDDLAGAAQVMR